MRENNQDWNFFFFHLQLPFGFIFLLLLRVIIRVGRARSLFDTFAARFVVFLVSLGVYRIPGSTRRIPMIFVPS